MIYTKIWRAILNAFILVCTGLHPAYTQDSTVEKDFSDPPAEYSILPFWSWNGTLENERVIWQLGQMMDKGIDGAFIHARAGLDESATPYFSDGFWNAIDTAVKWSAEHGFNIYLYDEDKWPSGSAGGRTLQVNRDEFIKKGLGYTTSEVQGPAQVPVTGGGAVGLFAARITGDREIDPASVVDIGALNVEEWPVPDGKWLIIAFEQFEDPQEQIDYLDQEAVRAFFNITHEAYFERFAKYFGNVIPGIFFDEIYANTKQKNSLVWTDDFLEQFKRIKGYDLHMYLPLLVYKGGAQSAQINFDYFDVVAQLYLEAWFKPYHDWCAAHGIWVTGHTEEGYENYLTQGDYFRTMGQLQVPGTDNEYFRYGHPRIISWRKPKQISSVAHAYGRGRNMAEAMGGGGYIIPLEEYRYGFAMLGAYGVNMFIPHLFHYEFETPHTKADWPASWFYRNPYWKYFRPLADYGSRISYMISQGSHVCDIALVYPLTSKWADGYSIKYDDRVHDELQGMLLKHYRDFDVLDPHTLETAVAVDAGLRVQDEQYSVLILPQLNAITAASAEKIRDFVEQGGLAIAVADLPGASPEGPEQSAMVWSQIDQLFGMDPRRIYRRIYNMDDARKHYYNVRTYPSGGKAVFTQYLWEVPSILEQFVPSDINVQSGTKAGLKFNHRKIDGLEVYFFVNEARESGEFRISLGVQGRPELWDPVTGTMVGMMNYTWEDGRTRIALNMKPWQAMFVVIHPGEGQPQEGMVTASEFEIDNIQESRTDVQVTGWVSPTDQPSVQWEGKGQVLTRSVPTSMKLPVFDLDGTWDFSLAQHDLDYVWTDTVSRSWMDLPVMQFQQSGREAGSPNMLDPEKWRWVRVREKYSALGPGERHVSAWDAEWINHYGYTKKLEKPKVWFRKAFDLEKIPEEAVADITADGNYTLYLNGHRIGSDDGWTSVESYPVVSPLKVGKNILEIEVTDCAGILVQLDISLPGDVRKTVKSGGDWEASVDGFNYVGAFVVAHPPLGRWGHIERPGRQIQYPMNLWYRVALPPGSVAISQPKAEHNIRIFVNGRSVEEPFRQGRLDIRPYADGGIDTLLVAIPIHGPHEGLQEAIRVLCGPVKIAPGDWQDHGLWWYSGRGVYSKTVHIPQEYINQHTRLELDLGEVAFFAEIWVNGKLVQYFPWGPFKADVTTQLRPGSNTIVVVVANLLSNKALWDIPDANLNDDNSRWWHHGRPAQEPDKLRAGLMGPVRIVPYTKKSITLSR
jgi:hypothetical protein